jgi:hypothetical protein
VEPKASMNKKKEFLLAWTVGSLAALLDSGTILKPNRLANLTQRSTRNGSSMNVSFGGKGVRIIPSRRSSNP